jgi:hypothetical protein
VDKKPLIGVSICAVVLLVLGSLSNVVGIESAQSCGYDDPPCWPELLGRMGENNWYVSTVKVTFNETLNKIYYRINGSNWINYTAPFTMKTQGIHLLEWTCDSNLSDIYSVEIKIDSGTPIFSNYKVKRIGLFKWQFSVNASDDTSGVNRVWFLFTDSFDFEPPYQVNWHGCYWLTWLSMIGYIYFPVMVWDNAGNYISQPS